MKKIVVSGLAISLALSVSSQVFATEVTEETENSIEKYHLMPEQFKPGIEEDTVKHTSFNDEKGYKVITELRVELDNGEIRNVEQLEQSQAEIQTERTNNTGEIGPMSPGWDFDVPYEFEGGMNYDSFRTEHAWEKHRYREDLTSTPGRTMYAKNVNVDSLWNATYNNPDNTVVNSYSESYFTRFKGNISTSDTPTDVHAIVINNDRPIRSTHYPDYSRGGLQ